MAKVLHINRPYYDSERASLGNNANSLGITPTGIESISLRGALRLQWSEKPQRLFGKLSLDNHHINEGRIIPAVAIESLEAQDMAPGTDCEATGAIRFVLEAARGKGAYDMPINQHLEVLYALIDSFTLSRIERDLIAACRKADRLAH